MKNKDFKICRKIADELRIELISCGVFGILARIRAYRRRKVFAVVFVILFAVFCMNFCFVSKISISGNTSLTEAQVLDILSESGVKYGTFAFFLDQSDVQRKMLENCDRLSWAWVEIRGTHAFAEIREKIPKPELFDNNFACNVIASRDGVIKRAVSSGGILYAKEGTYVRSGELLIGGVYDATEHTPVRFVHASGEILAQTFYTAEGNFGNSYIKYEAAKETGRVFGIRIGNFLIEKEKNDENVLLINDTEKFLRIFGDFYLPLSFTKREYCEIIEKKHNLSDSQTIQLALSELRTRLELMIPEVASVENEEESVSRNPDGSFHVRLTFECLENIGVELPIEITQE